MANYVTDDAICLRVLDFSETSQIVGLLTRRHGLVPMIAKGSKRQSKKNTMSGPLDLLTSGEVVFVPAKGVAGGGELATLAGWELVDHRNGLRKELAGLNGGMVAAEVTTMLVHPHDPHEGLYEELEATLELLGGAMRLRGLVAYVKAALGAAGYGVRFDVCGGCGKGVTAEGKVRFSTRGGGVFCGECGVEGVTVELAGRIAVALDRLVVPTVLKGEGGEKAGDAGALLVAMELLLGHVESITGKGMRTRGLLGGIFGQRRGF